MKPLLYVQIIHTTWTKKSRGAPLSTPRNAVPLALRLEDFPDDFLVVHRFDYSESADFQTPTPKHQKFEFTDDLNFKYGSFTLCWEGQTATTKFHPLDYSVGAPGIKSPDPRIGHFAIEANQWIRLRWQGRFSDFDEGSWWYEHTCINVAHFTITPQPHIFLQTEPARQFTHLPQLW
ncbi:hypothetical protein EON83_09360 [bacterium]|nr:MAG: hypothetical protein EON83_09360 [bacterium]